MAYQSGRNIRVAYKAETTFNTLAGASGATQFRVNSGGLNLSKAPINPGEIRPDGLITRGRHGQRDVKGSYEGDLSVGTFDGLFVGGFRNAFTARCDHHPGDQRHVLGDAAVAAHTITASAGSFITAGLRIGDIIRLGSGFLAGNQSKNLRITSLTATVITVAETLTVEAGPIASWSLTRPKKLLMGTTAGVVHHRGDRSGH